jgi:hypothetical protein
MGKLFADIKNPVKLAVMAALLVVCLWLVRRNIFAPLPQTTGAGRGAAVDAALGSRAAPGRRGQRGNDALADLDPTLRLDLLEAARNVEYRGSPRNIFQVYTPPPPPPPPAPPTPPPGASAGSQPSGPPPPPPISLKFYGTAQQSGGEPRKAFLLEGEEIFIAKEGDVVAKDYKVIRIGAASIEMEDTRNSRRQQLPLIEE